MDSICFGIHFLFGAAVSDPDWKRKGLPRQARIEVELAIGWGELVERV